MSLGERVRGLLGRRVSVLVVLMALVVGGWSCRWRDG